MAQKLKKFQVHKVSIVPYGANDETIQLHKSADSEVVLFKSAEYQGGKLMFDKLKKDEAPPGEMTEEEKKKKEEEEKAKESEKAEKSAPSKKNPLKKEAEAGAGKETPEEEKKEEEEKKKEEEKTEKSAPLVDIQKMIDQAVAKAVTPLQEENKILKADLGVEKSIRETAEYVQKAADFLPSLGKPSEVGPVILAIEKSNLSPDHKEAIQKLLLRAENLTKAAQPMLFKSMGYDGAAKVADSAAEEINKLARGLIQKSDKPLDLAAARSLIRKQYPDLAQKEREESRTVR